MLSRKTFWSAILAGICIVAGSMTAPAQAPADKAAAGGEGGVDYAALKMLRKGIALVDDRQDERGLKIIASVPLNFPKSGVRFTAALYLGKYYSEKNDFQTAIKHLSTVTDADDAEPDQRAEAQYRIGACYFGLNDYDRALSTLRHVTEAYPWSVYANEAYYYIGMCHFKMGRWKSAVEAFKLVGTSVPANAKGQRLVESGQRFFIKVQDKDLRVLQDTGGDVTVRVTTESGDSENLHLQPFDAEGETWLGSIKMELGKAVTNDLKLEVIGGDAINVEYTDRNAQDGTLNVKRLATSRTVSSAVIGFMDGAYREYVHGVFAGQPTFVRVKDFDADVSDQKDHVKVRLYSQYRPKVDEETASAADAEAPEWVVRDELEMTLEETEPHSGYFTGTVVINALKDPAEAVDKKDDKLVAGDKDTVCLDYVDKDNISGLNNARTIVAKADFLTGQIQDVWIAHREVDTEDLRARKNLVEARFYLRLAQIFRDVGLEARAQEKADIGLEKTEDVLRRSVQASIDQDLIAQAYEVKWELLLAKGDLNGAVTACHTLMALYPSSSLADVALLQIAKARIEAKQASQALPILQGVLGLKSSPDLKAEAQFLIGSILEENADKALTPEARMGAMAPAIEAYKACADKYPGSAFAGQSLGKVVDFYVESKDYDRSLELLQTIFTDFPDAPFLDDMLLKWGTVLAQTKKYDEARQKLQQLLSDYPNSRSAGKAQKLLELIGQRSSGG